MWIWGNDEPMLFEERLLHIAHACPTVGTVTVMLTEAAGTGHVSLAVDTGVFTTHFYIFYIILCFEITFK